MEVSVDIISTRVCNGPTVYGGAVTKHMLCAGDLSGGKDSCQVSHGTRSLCRIQRKAGLSPKGSGYLLLETECQGLSDMLCSFGLYH